MVMGDQFVDMQCKQQQQQQFKANSWDASHGGARQVLKPLGQLNVVYALSNLTLFSNAFLGG